MNLNPDDPRLTAYALGEMPENERATFEAELQKSPECRAEVEEIRRTSKLLSREMTAETSPELSTEQRRIIQEQLKPANVFPLPRRKVYAVIALAALAACLMLVMVWQTEVVRTPRTPDAGRQLAFVGPKPVSESAPSEIKLRLPLQEASVPEGAPAERKKDFTLNHSFGVDQPTTDSNSSKTKAEVPAFKSPPPDGSKMVDDSVSLEVATPKTKVILTGISSLAGERRSLATKKISEAAGSQPASLNGYYDNYDGYDKSLVESDDRSSFSDRSPRFEESQQETAQYPTLVENSFQSARHAPLSTFSIDVDTASYANVRRFLKEGRRPPRDAVRIEELVNYFTYKYPQPHGDDPFSANIEIASCPWNAEHRLVRIGLKGREIAREKRPPSNFVFLIDVSGSMQPQERLPLIKAALRQLVKKMNEQDRVALVVYASEAGLKLESTSCAEKEKILQAIDELGAGGSTNGGDGIRQAYRIAEENFIKDGVNRVLLCTDGDFNVGLTDQNELVRLIQQKARSGVFLTTLGVGTDNYKDALMQKLADKGNGNYHYLDTLEEAQKVLIDQMNGTLVTIAKDVKIQVEFNPAQVGAYRLIGYEKRMLRKEDFNNDAKDAGEIGAGHTVTALYEIVPVGREVSGAVDDLKYQPPLEQKPERYVATGSREMLTLKLRYKQPDGERSKLLEFPVTDNGKRFNNASKDFQFAAAVASFGMLLRDSEFKGNSSYGAVLEWAESAKGSDEEGYRAEFLNVVRQAQRLR